jgi:hypothetical protein
MRRHRDQGPRHPFRRELPLPYWVVECPVTSDQGVVEAWFTDRGTPILVCDVCHATWFDRNVVPEEAVFPDQAGVYEDGDSVYTGRSRPATRDELEQLGWWELVHPLSRRAHGDTDS